MGEAGPILLVLAMAFAAFMLSRYGAEDGRDRYDRGHPRPHTAPARTA